MCSSAPTCAGSSEGMWMSDCSQSLAGCVRTQGWSCREFLSEVCFRFLGSLPHSSCPPKRKEEKKKYRGSRLGSRVRKFGIHKSDPLSSFWALKMHLSHISRFCLEACSFTLVRMNIYVHWIAVKLRGTKHEKTCSIIRRDQDNNNVFPNLFPNQKKQNALS